MIALAEEIGALTLTANPSPRGVKSATPEGYGFSSRISRILKARGAGASGSPGYYAARASTPVVEVMEGINGSGDTTAALVFADDVDGDGPPPALLGIFTDADYVKLAMERAGTCTVEESAAFVAAPVSNFVTPAERLVCVEESSTASQAVAVMTANDIRHAVVLDSCGPDFSYRPGGRVRGVISMQDVLRVIQVDERLTFDKLSGKYPLLSGRPIEQMREEMKSRANSLASNDETGKRDVVRTGAAALFAGSVLLFATQSDWLAAHAEPVMIGIFVLGYVGIIFEQVFEFNKAAVALLMSTGLWITYADFYGDKATGSASAAVLDQLKDQLAEVSDICFFLLAASAIVEVVDAHQGFKVVTNLITTKSKRGLFWVIGILTFFLSAILNNLTVTIVMVSLLRKLIPDDEDRRLFGAMVVVAANAGGVWTPIGDVTTTMLWINNQLSTVPTVTRLFLPSLVCLVASMAVIVNQVEEDSSLAQSTLPSPSPLATRGQVVFWAGIASLLAVPVFSELTGLPPYLAMVSLATRACAVIYVRDPECVKHDERSSDSHYHRYVVDPLNFAPRRFLRSLPSSLVLVPSGP
jgi:CBS domain-containing protein